MSKSASFTRAEAASAFVLVERALETDEVWEALRATNKATGVYAALVVIEDYLQNSKAVPLTNERTREELYAQQVGARAS